MRYNEEKRRQRAVWSSSSEAMC